MRVRPSFFLHQERERVRETVEQGLGYVRELVPVKIGVLLKAFQSQSCFHKGVHDLAQRPLAFVDVELHTFQVRLTGEKRCWPTFASLDLV